MVNDWSFRVARAHRPGSAGSGSIEVRRRSLALAEGDDLLQAIQSDEAALLVLSLSSPRLPGTAVSKLLDHISNPVLLIQ